MGCRLTQTLGAVVFFFASCAVIIVIRVTQLYHRDLYSQLYTVSGYVSYIAFILILLSVLMVWQWEAFDFRNKEKFTICYLCCIGSDADLELKTREHELSIVLLFLFVFVWLFFCVSFVLYF